MVNIRPRDFEQDSVYSHVTVYNWLTCPDLTCIGWPYKDIFLAFTTREIKS